MTVCLVPWQAKSCLCSHSKFAKVACAVTVNRQKLPVQSQWLKKKIVVFQCLTGQKSAIGIHSINT